MWFSVLAPRRTGPGRRDARRHRGRCDRRARPGVSTSLTNVANGRAQTLMSIERGEYRAVALQPASYRVTALRDDEVRRRR